MRLVFTILGLVVIIATGCGDVLVDRNREVRDDSDELVSESSTSVTPASSTAQPFTSAPEIIASLNGRLLSAGDLDVIESAYGLRIGSGDFWYDPVSGAWGYWGGPTLGFLMPRMELGRPPPKASGGGTGVFLNGRELHPMDLGGLQRLLGFIYPGYYWLDAKGYFGYQGSAALGNLIHVAQGSSSASGGAYFDSTYFGNIGSDGQNSYFYDSQTGCSVMSDGGLSC